MSQTYYLWTSYKGITNMMNIYTGTYELNTVETWNDILFRGEGNGAQNYYQGIIGHHNYVPTHAGVIIKPEDMTEESVLPEGTFLLHLAGWNSGGTSYPQYYQDDSDGQNLQGPGTIYRRSMDSFHDKTGLNDDEIANFYGKFGVSRGFNRAYRIKTSTAYTSSNAETETAMQAKVSINDDGNYVDLVDGDFQIRFSDNQENPFEGVGILFGFATWPLKENILLPNTPNKFDKTYALKCFFDEDVTDLQTSHVTATNCTVLDIYKKSAKEQWVIFTINTPAAGNFYTEYTLTVEKENVTAVNDSNKKNRSQTITYNCLSNDGSVIWVNKHGGKLSYSTDLGNNWTETDLNRKTEIIRYFGNFFYTIDYDNPDTKYSYNGLNWQSERTGATPTFSGIRSLEQNKCLQTRVNDIAKGKDGSGNDLIIAVGTNGSHSTWRTANTDDYSIAYSRDGGINWYANGRPSEYRFRQHGHAGLGNFPYKDPPYVTQDYTDIPIGYSIAYGNGIWVFGGLNNNDRAINLLYSNDGYSFYPAANYNDEYHVIQSIVFVKDTFIFAAATGEVGYSTDGENWTVIDTKPLTDIRRLVTDGSGVVIAFGWNSTTTNDRFMSYSTDKGLTWNAPTTTFNFDQDRYNYANGVWNGSQFIVAAQSNDNTNRLLFSPDGDTWTYKEIPNTGDGNFNVLMTNYYPEESNESEVPGITKPTVAQVLNADASLNYFPTDYIPEEWWQNMVTSESNVIGRIRENDTRRNFLFKKIFEANESFTYFDISTNNLQMTENTVKDTIRVYKKDSNNSFEINYNTNTTINKDLGYYVILENVNDKVNFTNATNDISFNIVRTGTDSDGNATYNVEKTGGTNNLIIDF